MSRPEQKPRPAPVTTSARSSGRAPTSWIASWSSSIIDQVSAFSLSGRFRVSTAIPTSGVSSRMSSLTAVLLVLGVGRRDEHFEGRRPVELRAERLADLLERERMGDETRRVDRPVGKEIDSRLELVAGGGRPAQRQLLRHQANGG